MVDGGPVEQHRAGDASEVATQLLVAAEHRVGGPQRGPGVAVLLDTVLLDVVGDAGHRGEHVLERRQQLHVLAVGGDRRVDQHEPGRAVGVVGGEPERQGAAHREATDEDVVDLVREGLEGLLDLSAPVGPGGLVHVLPGSAVAGQSRSGHGVPLAREVLRPRPHRRRRPGEPVHEQDADASPGRLGVAFGDEGLGEGTNGHGRSPEEAVIGEGAAIVSRSSTPGQRTGTRLHHTRRTPAAGRSDLSCLDTSHPQYVAAVAHRAGPEATTWGTSH